MTININRRNDLVLTIYASLTSPNDPLKAGSKDTLSNKAKAFMKTHGLKGKEAFQKTFTAFKEALGAHSFVQAVHKIKGGGKSHLNSFEKSRLLEVFNKNVQNANKSTVPNVDQIKAFGNEWGLVEAGRGKAFSIGFGAVQDVVDSDSTSPAFPILLPLYKLKRDPEFAKLSTEGRLKYICEKYPSLSNSHTLEQRKFGNIVRESSNQKELVRELLSFYKIGRRTLQKGLKALEEIYQTAMEEPLVLLNSAKNTSADILKICKTRQQIKSIFRGFSTVDIERVLKHFGDPSTSTDTPKLSVIMGARLWGRDGIQLDQVNRSFLTKNQLAILKTKDQYVEQAEKAIRTHLLKLIKKGETQKHLNFQKEMQAFIAKHDKENITEQFKKDGHRYGQLILAEPTKNPVLYPGNNTVTSAKPALLAKLRDLAKTDKEFDPKLFRMLQEAICQNLEKLGTEHWVKDQLTRTFEPGVEVLLTLNWRKNGLYLEKTSDTEFVALHKYTLRVLNMEDESSDDYNMQVTYPIKKEANGWIFEQAKINQINNSDQTAKASKKPIPLPALPAPETHSKIESKSTNYNPVKTGSGLTEDIKSTDYLRAGDQS